MLLDAYRPHLVGRELSASARHTISWADAQRPNSVSCSTGNLGENPEKRPDRSLVWPNSRSRTLGHALGALGAIGRQACAPALCKKCRPAI